MTLHQMESGSRVEMMKAFPDNWLPWKKITVAASRITFSLMIRMATMTQIHILMAEHFASAGWNGLNDNLRD